MKKTVSLILLLTILLTCLSSCSTFFSSGLKYTREGDSYTVKAKILKKSSYVDLVIPEKHFGRPVTKIEADGFDNCYNLRSVTIPNTVTEIGSSAFSNCDKLITVNLPNSITEIKLNTFRNCTSLTRIELPESVRKIGSGAFHDCDSLTTITIPEGMETIIGEAFSNCDSLYVVYNYSSVKMTLGTDEAGGVAKRATMLFDNGTLTVKQDGYDYILKDGLFLFAHKNAKYYLMAYCGNEEKITLPVDINGYSYDIYKIRGVIDVVIPGLATYIPEKAFAKCLTLRSVVVPDGVITICKDAFDNCSSLHTVVLPASIKKLEYNAFGGCTSIENVYYKGTSRHKLSIEADSYNYDLTRPPNFYYYSENKPTEEGKYWHYDDDGKIVVWSIES